MGTTSTEVLRHRRTAVRRLSKRAGCNRSERRAGLEKHDAEADPPLFRGRLAATGTAQWGDERSAGRPRRGSGDSMGKGTETVAAIPLAGTLPT